jgi:hypothetical protein
VPKAFKDTKAILVLKAFRATLVLKDFKAISGLKEMTETLVAPRLTTLLTLE